MPFVVTDTDGQTLFVNDRALEKFDTQEAAFKRAKEAADAAPGEQFEVYQRIAVALAPVSPAEIEQDAT